jgi:hypothetical protein
MKAIELTETGGLEVMHLRLIPTPIPQEKPGVDSCCCDWGKLHRPLCAGGALRQ